MPALDLDRLFTLRLAVARHGEMDVDRWWNSKGMLGRFGRSALSRGFPRTHFFAQARVVFAVARERCAEVFAPPGCLTLWHLPAELEDRFEDAWHRWLGEGERWQRVFDRLAVAEEGDLLGTLAELEILTKAQTGAAGRLRLSAEGRAVPLPGTHSADDDTLTLLAAGFARGGSGHLAIPYARLEG